MKSEKQENSKNKPIDKTLVSVITIVIVVLVIIILALVKISNPFENRKYRLDNIVMNDFQNINYEIQDYYQSKKTLPDTLNFANSSLSEETKQRIKSWNYKYTKESDKKYSLCAVFQTDGSKNQGSNYYRYGYYGENFTHKIGYDCIKFEVSIEDSKYPVIIPVPTYH